MTGRGSGTIPYITCDICGKRGYETRKAAKLARRRYRASNGRQTIYECGDRWHLGTLAPGVISGRITRDVLYNRPRNHRPTDRDHLEPEAPMTATTTADDLQAIMLNSDGQHSSDLADSLYQMLMADTVTYRTIPQVPVSPALARRLLGVNDDVQRHARDSLTARYARDMGTRRWRERNGQPINISHEGTLINGQHRLWAVILSGMTICFDFQFGVDRKDIVVVDAGPARSAIDVIRVSGGGDLRGISPVIRWILMWEMGIPMGRGGNYAPTPLELQGRYQADIGLFNAAAARGGDVYARNLTSKAVGGTAYFLLARKNIDVANDFFDALVSGLGMGTDGLDARWRLRERLLGRAAERAARHEQLALFIRAWNMYNTIRHGSRIPCKKLQITADGPLNNDNFPVPRAAAVLGTDTTDADPADLAGALS